MTLSNNPPAFEAHSLHVEELFALVSDTTAAGVVTNDDQEAALDELMDDLRTAKKGADAERAAEKKPHDEAAKAVQAKWKPLIDRCDMGLTAVKNLLTPYREAKKRAAEAAAAQARRGAEERTAAAQMALRQSDDLETRFAAEAVLKQATKLQAVANRVDRTPTGLRTLYRAEVTDATAFARWAWANRRTEYLQFLADLAAREVRATGATTTIPGILVHTERKAA